MQEQNHRTRYEKFYKCLLEGCNEFNLRSDNRNKHCEKKHECGKERCNFNHYKINLEAQFEQIEEKFEEVDMKLASHADRINKIEDKLE